MKTAIGVAVVIVFLASTSAGKGATGEAVPLAKAVAEFNKNVAQQSSIGITEPPLTEDEVVAAIRVIDRKLWRMNDEIYQEFQKIAESKQLPGTAKLIALAQASDARFEYEMWRIDLEVMLGPQLGFRYPLRTHMVKSYSVVPSADRIRVEIE